MGRADRLNLLQEQKEQKWRNKVRSMEDRYKAQLDENTHPGVLDEIVYHGLKHTGTANLQKNFDYVCYCQKTQVIQLEIFFNIKYNI